MVFSILRAFLESKTDMARAAEGPEIEPGRELTFGSRIDTVFSVNLCKMQVEWTTRMRRGMSMGEVVRSHG